jgi:hypothetical protein
MPRAMEVLNLRQSGQSSPVLPKLVLAMSVPLFLGYWIKNVLLPNFLFVVFYSWSIFSFIFVPLLCLAECFILVKAGLSRSPEKTEGLRPHAIGLAIGTAAMLASYLVKWYG